MRIPSNHRQTQTPEENEAARKKIANLRASESAKALEQQKLRTEAKTPRTSKEESLLAMGLTIWVSNNLVRRIYIERKWMQITGITSAPYGHGEGNCVSHRQARNLAFKASQTYFDCATQTFVGPLADMLISQIGDQDGST